MMSETNSLSIIASTRQLKVESESAQWKATTETLCSDPAILSQFGTQTQEQDDLDVISQSVPPSLLEKQPWGFLSCIRSNLTIRLVNDQFLVGRKNPLANYTFDEKLLSRHYQHTSRQHFRIFRTPLRSGQWLVSIEDLSTAGTFINGVLIGKNKKMLLLDKNIISVNRPKLEVFIFFDQQYKITVPGIPPEITANYLVTDCIGKGGFGHVYLVIKQNSRKKLAMKAIKLEARSKEDRSRFLNEPDIMYKIQHPNIIKIFDVHISNGLYLFIFMEFVQGGDLHNYLESREKNLTEAQAKFIFYQLVMAVAILHRQNIVHRDIKPGNILCSHKEVEFPHIKLTDFGLSKILSYSVEPVQTRCGTKKYSAPELNTMFDRQKQRHYFDARCDVWSVGVVFYYCLCRSLPYVEEKNKNVAIVEDQMQRNSFSFVPAQIWGSVSMQAKYHLRCMIKYEYFERPTSEQLLSASYFTEDLTLIRRYRSTCLYTKTKSSEFAGADIIPKKIARLDNNL